MSSSEFTYYDLSEAYRAEMHSRPLTKVPEDLYRVMAKLIGDLKHECHVIESKDPESLMLMEARDKLSASQRMVKSIVVNRAHKVYLRALRAAEMADVQLDDLTPEEERYYHEVLGSTRKQLGVTDDYLSLCTTKFNPQEQPFEEVP